MSFSKLLLYGVLILLCCSCSRRPVRTSYVINADMDVEVWKDPSLDAPERSFKKLTSGDLIIIDGFYSNIANRFAAIPPAIQRIIIPVRSIGPLGKLKEYEKDFLLAFIATNSRNTFDSITVPLADREFVQLWNYIMNNLYAVKNSTNKDFFRVQIDYKNFEAISSNKFYNSLKGNTSFGKRDLLIPFLNKKSYTSFFIDPYSGINNNKFFYNDSFDSDVTRPHSYFSYSVSIQGYSYNKGLTPETSTWNVYDWLYADAEILTNGTVSPITDYPVLKFYQFGGRWHIIKDTANYHVRYNPHARNSDKYMMGDGRKKNISERDLLNLFPVNIHNFRKITY